MQRCATVLLIAIVVIPVSLHLHSTATLKNNAPSGGMNDQMPEMGNANTKPGNSSSMGATGNDSAGIMDENAVASDDAAMDTTPPGFASDEEATEEDMEEVSPPSNSDEENTKEELSESEEDSAKEDGISNSISDSISEDISIE